MPVISVDHLTQDYGHGRGVFDVSLEIDKGECYGFLGPNGAGKTTTIRHLMGFSKPQAGKTSVQGLDSWHNSATLQNSVGYLPGEVTLPNSQTGTNFLHMMERMRHIKNDDRLNMLLERFQLDPGMPIKRMSLGVKRKLAVVTAFMHDPDILILDEPTSGLDPIMQNEFIQFVREEKARGKTIFLSSHIFHEVDATCDRIAIIRKGRIASEFRAGDLRNNMDRIYHIKFQDEASLLTFLQNDFHVTLHSNNNHSVRIQIPVEDTPRLISVLSQLRVEDFVEIPFTLEDYFMTFYSSDELEEAAG